MDAIVAFVLIGAAFVSLLSAVESRQISITPSLLLALLPWFGLVGSLYAFEEAVTGFPAATLFIRTPTAYVTVGVLVLATWLIVDRVLPGRENVVTATLGILSLVTIGTAVAVHVAPRQTGVLRWNAVAIVLAVVLTAAIGIIRNEISPDVASGWLGTSVIFAHILDAMTTAIGLEVLGAIERNPISAAIISVGDSIYQGVPGVVLFLGIKIAVALLVVQFMRDSKSPLDVESSAFLVVTAGVGLAPAVHNLVLFSLAF